jgi:prolyl oligopeptidase
MYAYGGFGTTEKPTFTLSDVILFRNLEGIQVIVHTRGGGELGETWHQMGQKEHR